MDTTLYEHELKTKRLEEQWQNILNNTFEYMELYYWKQFPILNLLLFFKKSFGITPITLKTFTDDAIYRYRILAIYILTKYSKEEFSFIAQEFRTSIETIENIASNKSYQETFEKEIRHLFKQVEYAFLFTVKSSLALDEIIQNF